RSCFSRPARRRRGGSPAGYRPNALWSQADVSENASRYASPVATSDPALWTTTEQAAAIRRRELGSVELLDAELARIERLDPQVNAVCTMGADAAQETAGGAAPQ